MSEKRRDNKNRILKNGEYQDKNGRYVYRYTDKLGKRIAVYSWRLTKNDPHPKGKTKDISLREKECIIIDELRTNLKRSDMTVLELVDKYIEIKKGVRNNTQAGYKYIRNVLSKEEFANKKINQITLSDAKLFLIKLKDVDKRGYSTVRSVRGVLRPAFQLAVDDDLILKNPFNFQLATIVVNDSVTREAITNEEERNFLNFVKNDNHYKKYYDAMYILFKTGIRISEFCGLTINDIDLDNNILHINHQLLRLSNMTYHIEMTKTNAGTRDLPLTSEVKNCFKRILDVRYPPKIEPIIDGYTGFLFYDKNNMPMVALHWEKYFSHAVDKYNRTYIVQLPKITPHICRHTYCSNMARAGMSPKTLQYLMGHSDICVTMNTYTHIGFVDAAKELERLHLDGTSKRKKSVRINPLAI